MIRPQEADAILRHIRQGITLRSIERLPVKLTALSGPQPVLFRNVYEQIRH